MLVRPLQVAPLPLVAAEHQQWQSTIARLIMTCPVVQEGACGLFNQKDAGY